MGLGRSNGLGTESRRPHWSVLLVIMASIGVAFVLGRNSNSPSQQADVPSPRSKEGQRLAALEREVRALRAQGVQARRIEIVRDERAGEEDLAEEAQDDEREDEDAREVPALPLDPEAEARLHDEQAATFFADLEQRLDREPVDRAWSGETEPLITQLIPERMGAEVTISEVNCSSTLCRAKLEHPEWPQIPAERFAQFTLNRDALGTMAIQMDGRDEGTTVLYFMRAANET